MSTKIAFTKKPGTGRDTAVVVICDKKGLSEPAKKLDKKTGGLIATAIKKSKKFEAKNGQTLVIQLPSKAEFDRVICLGAGKGSEWDALKAETAGGKLFAALEAAGAGKVAVLTEKQKDEKLAAHLAAGLKLRSYKFNRYKSKKQNNKGVTHIDIVSSSSAAAKHFAVLNKVTEGTFLARDLVNEPPNHLNPPKYAQFLKKELTPLGVSVEVLDEKKMKALGMGAILAVGMGSSNPPRMVIMRWNGTPKKAKKAAPVALIGKGVTFDTGGISIKPAPGMDEMKMDMGGSAAVAGAMKALALRKAKVDVIGIVGLAENMPSGDAYRPGDIIKSYAGKTIEVLNTDAEGRLVLVDCLAYVQKKYKPRMIIDLATLTGAMMVALGHEYCGTFANDDKLWKHMEGASAETGEKLWRMPLDEVWRKDMVSNVADLQNLGKSGRFAGACTAAAFLEHFIEKGTPWAHMDIAGTAWRKSDQPTSPKYGSGFGVRVLDRIIANGYEGK